MSHLILASGSPRRRDLLASAGIDVEVLVPCIDESPRDGETAPVYVERMAREKCEQVARAHPDDIVLAADTIVVLDGRILGKPRDAEDAMAMLHALSGQEHDVITAVALACGTRFKVLAPVTRVRFAALSEEEIARYVAGGEPMDKAGAYAIQGEGTGLIRSINGSYTNVVGLPLREVIDILREYFDFAVSQPLLKEPSP